ncbi:hypothetical protein GN958_ATG18549 [Phytophthora infestans]|uniref:Uncharacterized protein n=1 Tax=Phytophthora infestans TaxID=4787 RepID=A0A8S9TTY2_PHYIN|nr:hypothetical protein GN958_ATG18549 [Phytophthora infestans]
MQGKRCRDRLCALRFPGEDINEVKALLLDPRIKTKVASIVKGRSLLEQAKRGLQREHDELYRKLFSSDLTEQESETEDIVPTSVLLYMLQLK